MSNKVSGFKMTTPIPASSTTLGSVETSIGTLEFFDGVPKADTVSRVYGYLDRARAVEVFIDSILLMSMAQLRQGQADARATAAWRHELQAASAAGWSDQGMLGRDDLRHAGPVTALD